jgi:nitrogen fixation negative regulator NifL
VEKKRIIIVEDEFIVASDLENRLVSLGYDVVGRADTGDGAVETCASARPDLVLMDIRLKGEMDGIEAARIIRERFGAPVVFVTAFADESTLERAKEAEPYGYILKPFENRELRTIIEIALYKRKSEQEIQRLNRLYAALSQINETIIRAESRADLFENVCRVATETAGFKLAWIGALDPKTLAVQPVATSGEGREYLNEIRVIAKDCPEGKGPTGTCARTREACVFNDFFNDPRTAFWRDATVKYNIRSAAALPLLFNKKVYGVLTVYGDEPDVFQEEEMSLLREAAADISFALDHIEQQVQLRKLAAAVEQSPALILITDAAGNIEYVNSKFEKVTGYGADFAVGRNPRFLKSGKTSPEEYRRLWETITAGREWRGEFHNRKKSGGFYWESTSISPIIDADGKITHFLSVKEDITEQKRTQEELRKSEAKWRSYLENAPVGILVADATGRHIEANHTMEKMLGYPPGGILGTSIQDMLVDPHDKTVAEHFAELRRNGFAAGEFQLLRKNSESIWVSIRAMELGDGRLLGVFQDITRSRQLESDLRQAQKLEAVARLAGGVAHDFNNILAAILMQLSLLQMRPDLDLETKEMLKELDSAATRGSSIVRQLLLFSRTSTMSVKPVDLNSVFAQLLIMLRRLIGEDVKIEFDPGVEPHWVDADVVMMEQVVMNLAVNARDAMPRGGRIKIAVSSVNMGESSCAGNPNRRPGRFICLATSDTGCGMDAATMKRIFEPFFTTKEPGKGTGLGLATVHGIVAQHKGWIEVESKVGQGTTFLVYIPACDAPTEATFDTDRSTALPRGNECILLVEDEPSVRRSAAQTLRVLGYAVHEASDGKAAIELWNEKNLRVDLLLTDMVMPNGINGLDLIERLRTLEPGLKAILFTGYSEDIAKRGAIEMPGVTFLAKPCRAVVIANTVRNALDARFP